jgi:hypothetical protein
MSFGSSSSSAFVTRSTFGKSASYPCSATQACALATSMPLGE